MIRKAITAAAVVVALLCSVMGRASAADAPLVLKWAQLVPPQPAVRPKLKPFFSGAPAGGDNASGTPAPPPLPEGKFMSTKRRQPGSEHPPAVVETLNGKRVQIGGYIVPLDFEATRIKEFLLVPFVGACIHVPPPPANQIIYVKSDKGVDISGSFDPVTVTGTLKTETAFTGVADAGYSLAADEVAHIKK